MGTPDDIAKGIVFLASDDAAFMTGAGLVINGGITAFDPNGGTEHFPFPDLITTNICFGGRDMKTAYITLSWTGKLVAVDWPTAGLKLNQVD